MKKLTKQMVGAAACALFLAGCQAEAQSNESVAVKGTSQEGQVTAPEEAVIISLDEAKTIALNHAGVKEEAVIFDEAELDESDRLYELEFEVDETEFEYDIEALTGEILKAERDEDDERDTDSSADASLTIEEALTVALEHAGVDRESVTMEDSEWDDDDQIIELEFFTKNTAFDYDIHAMTGDILEAEQESRDSKSSNKTVSKTADKAAETTNAKEKKTDAPTEKNNETKQNTKTEPKKKVQTSPAYIGLDKAKQIALAHAGEALSSVRFDDQELDKDDQLYELEFASSDTEYEYDIDALSGKIVNVEKEQEVKMKRESKQVEVKTKQEAKTKSETKEPVKSEPVQLTKEQAIAVALKHAGLNKDQVVFDDVEKDDDDGRIVWEIEFDSSSYEFEYEIDAKTG
ncbi:MAG: PepSY domain-containing protein, partial [Alkalibacterium sp.]